MKKSFIICAVVLCLTTGLCTLSCSSNVEVTGGMSTSATPDLQPMLKVYIENSGSMDGYMCDGSQLKDAVYDYVSDLNRYSDTVSLYYINKVSIPYKGEVRSYIKDLNPTSFRQAGGNRSNSNIGDMISAIVDGMSSTDVSMFISDCILDITVSDSQKYLRTCQIDIKEAIIKGQKKIDNFSVEVLKMSSDFKGNYYYQNGRVEVLDSVQRPYYIWLMGSKAALERYNQEVPLSDLSKYGMSEMVAFTDFSEVPFQIKNRYLTSNVIKPVKGKLQLTLQADMNPTLQPEAIILNASNYRFSSQGITIERLDHITTDHAQYTHSIQISIPDDVHVSDVLMSFEQPSLPSWISASNDESGNNVKSNIDKTTGIKYLIQGIADAYKKQTILTSFKFNLKNR